MMDKLTPFQKALLSSVSEEYAAVPQEEELTEIAPIDQRKSKRHISTTLRRSLITAAVILVLAGSVFAAVRFALEPEVKKSTYELPEFEQSNDMYSISFKESLAAEDAPEEIQVYMLPSLYVSREALSDYSCYFEDEDNSYYPLADNYRYFDEEDDCYYPLTNSYENCRPLDGKVQTAHYEWWLDDYGQITFQQQTARSVTPGKSFMNIHLDSDSLAHVSYTTFTMGEYEILSFEMDFSAYEELAGEENAVLRQWYWTDGNYLYYLSCGIGVSDEEMLEIFESVAPVEDINAYLGIEE